MVIKADVLTRVTMTSEGTKKSKKGERLIESVEEKISLKSATTFCQHVISLRSCNLLNNTFRYTLKLT